jgi:molecular chaperone DnaK (HSP70)
LREQAQRHTKNSNIETAVITVPAQWPDPPRADIKEAGEDAGFTDVYILEEPTAAAIAYGLTDVSKGKAFLVFDLGAASLDVSVSTWNRGELSVRGKASGNIGGMTFDDEIFQFVVGMDPRANSLTSELKAQLRLACANAKKLFDSTATTTIAAGNVSVELSREEFERIVTRHLPTIRKTIEEALKQAGMQRRHMNHILLVGGASRISKIQDDVKKFFGKPAAT